MAAALTVFTALAGAATALQNGFGRTPILGFNTYNDVACSPNETYVSDTIQALSQKGFPALGYKYFQVDCGWQGQERQSNGSITYDTTRFPHGISPLSNLANKNGVIWSMYTDQGVKACDTTSNPPPGSLGYEKQDAAMFAAWNAQYVKVDNCYVTADDNAPKSPRGDFVSRYTAMSSALQNVGIKGILVCQWGIPYQPPSGGLQGPAQWTPALSTSFRVSDDIATGWTNVARILNEAINVNLRNLSGPGNFADMDLLEVGNPGMTTAEQQSHFAVWAMFKSALMVSTSISRATATTLAILTNKDLLAVNQDALGAPVTLVQRFSNDYDLFAGPLAGGDRAVLLLDQSNAQRTLAVDFVKDLGIASADVKNLWTGQTVKGATKYSVSVAAHGSAPLRLSNVKSANAASPALTYYEAEAAQVTGGAAVASCSGCSGGSKVGYIGQGSVTFANVKASAATVDVRFDYVNGDVGYLGGGDFANVRSASVSVNGGAAQNVLFPLSGYNWDVDVLKSFKVRLSGFKVGSTNTVKISGMSGGTQYAPDLDRIGVPS